ncbi:MAG: SF1B family DNA helicase RecD2 [Eubacteriales bacterium]
MIDFNEKEDKELLTVEGTIEHIIYQNEENGYAVCELSVSDTELITVVGIMPYVSAGETVKAMGKWQLHASFGRQFKIEYYEKQLPANESAMLKYLSSRAVKGIGPASAVKIIERFGEDTFDVLENHPQWLAEIPGISKKKAEGISEEFRRQFGIRSVMMFCRDYFGPATAVRIYKKWGGSAVDIIKENPYSLCDDIYGVGFERADKIAASMGVDKNSLYRIKAGIKYLITYNASHNGHVYIPENRLIRLAMEMLDISSEMAEDAVNKLCDDNKVKRIKRDGNNAVYAKNYYEAEVYTAQKLDLLDKLCPKLDMDDIERFISLIELESGMNYAAMQKRAIVSAVNNGVMVLTGGPGTGKTTVIKAVMRVFDRLDTEIALAAPTGRAAKRMSEATSREAKTIHRLLEMEFADDTWPRFKRNEDNTLDERVIIIDETSMVDISLIASLLKAIKPGARLILIGDSDQLPSVGAGNVLHDIIASERFNTIRLKEIFRQASESLIITNAHAINTGEYPELDNKDTDFFFLPRENDSDIARTVADLCLNRLPKTYGEKIRSNLQIITPSRKGGAGTAVLNNMLQEALNPPSPKKREKKTHDIILREGDKVMQIKNNYNITWQKEETEGIGIFNGDIGIILAINYEDETLQINFDERIAVYEFSLLDELEHAYAITVHKSQGSEYPVVIIPMYGFAPQLMTRKLLYTAVTRAQEKVIMVGRRDVVAAMVDNNRPEKRYSGLSELLRSYDCGKGEICITNDLIEKLKESDASETAADDVESVLAVQIE